MALTSKISHYQTEWPNMYEAEALRLTPIFGEELQDIHHIGSTAVPGLAAKPEIDILAIVDSVSRVDEWVTELGGLQYRRGGDLSPGHLFFKRDRGGVRTHKIHICRADHPKIHEMLSFRDYLKRHSDVRDEYEALKLRLETSNLFGIGEYLRQKEPFIRAVLAKIDRL